MKNPSLDAQLTLAHLNIRREKAGEDDGAVAVDLKFTAELGADALKGLFATPHSFDTILGRVWTGNGELASSDLDELKLTRELTGCKVTLKPEHSPALSFESGDLNKIKLRPLAGRICEVSLRVQLHPDEEQIAWLAERYGSELRVTLAQKQGSLDLQQPATASQAAPVH